MAKCKGEGLGGSEFSPPRLLCLISKATSEPVHVVTSTMHGLDISGSQSLVFTLLSEDMLGVVAYRWV